MPKPLSLKKTQGKPLKSQKAITQFFSNKNAAASSELAKSETNVEKTVSNECGKRKAVSPNIEYCVEKAFTCGGTVRVSKKLKIASAMNTTFKENNAIQSQLCLIDDSKSNNCNIKGQCRSPLASDIANSCDDDMNLSSSKMLTLKSPRKSTKKSITPNKSPLKDFIKSPIIKHLSVVENCKKDELSPSKKGSVTKILDFDQTIIVDDLFSEEWQIEDADEDFKEDLDLSIMQRCEILSVIRHCSRLEIKLKNKFNNKGVCFVEGMWLDTPLFTGDIVSVIATKDSSGQFFVGNSSGIIVLRPDHLVSSTSVVAGVFCRRKAVLQERWKGIDAGNTAMTIGVMIHELVQKALTDNISDIPRLRKETEKIIKESVHLLYDAGLGVEEANSNMQNYVIPLADFMRTYVVKQGSSNIQKDQWTGHIDKVLDIEENLCCPKLGLKGKIDATLEVTIHERKGKSRAVVPLELKSGKASVSAEHRGQLVMYGMMLSALNGADPTSDVQRGLLLYLKEKVNLREVSCGYPERRDLMMLRNQLVQNLAPGPDHVDTEKLADIEDASILFQQKLPDPIQHENACARCSYLTLCSLHLWHTDGPTVSDRHPLHKLREQAMGHLTAEHVKYFLQWTALLKIEERGQMNTAPLYALWTESAEKRAKRGTCAANLKLKSVEATGDRFLHVFQKQQNSDIEKRNSKGPQENEFSIVSIDDRPWIAAGVVSMATETEITILLERDLSRRLNKSTVYHIDTYESYATTVQNLTNLGVLIEDSERAERLRKLIIDKEAPKFEKKLPRDVGRLGSKLMRSLNIEQQRAVLKALAAQNYALLRGLPGTGKTQTISVLIQMLVGLKQRVLVTAHTHSAVDNVLSRLPSSIKVLRLGSTTRVSEPLLPRCEERVTSHCKDPKKLEEIYNSMEVVGVTCLGAAHALLAKTTFDICIVDEATQVLQCTVLRPLFAAQKFVLVGDPEQLPPVVRSRAARRLGMEESLFHRLMNEEVTSTLRLQYRMNQPLVDIANSVAYDSKLKCADEKVADARLSINIKKIKTNEDWILQACSPASEKAAMFLDMQTYESKSMESTTCSNSEEACIVMALVEALKEGGVSASDIGVIAPYRDQVSLLRKALLRVSVEVSTVDQFQGRDKSVIIYSCSKRDNSKDDQKSRDGEVLNDQRRLAVSVTRAKHKLLIIGNSRALKLYTPLQKLINACTSLCMERDSIMAAMEKYKTLFI